MDLKKQTQTRQIKFRAWDKTYSLMNYKVQVGNTDHADPNYTCNSIWVDSGDFKTIGWMNADDKCIYLMQFTGLTDKNGKEIYEGDMVQRGVITFSRGKFQGTYFDSNGDFAEDWEDDLCQERDIEVLGNIFENPELLKE